MKIFSKRNFEKFPSWHLVYEWEEDIAGFLGCSIDDYPRITLERSQVIWIRILRKMLALGFVVRMMRFLYERIFSFSDSCIVYELISSRHISFMKRPNSIVLIIDFWERDLDRFRMAYSACRYVGISSLEAYTILQRRFPENNFVHIPLSLSDRYKPSPVTCFEKKIDVVLAGRENPVLVSYMERYAQSHTSIEYVYRTFIDGEAVYLSNKRGFLGAFSDRESYLSLLRQARIGLYSTPGIDDGKAGTNGYNPVTPRFLELIASGCFVIARYPNNEDTLYYKLDEMCYKVESYQEFEVAMQACLAQKRPPLEKYSKYLEQHYTSVVASRLKNLIKGT